MYIIHLWPFRPKALAYDLSQLGERSIVIRERIHEAWWLELSIYLLLHIRIRLIVEANEGLFLETLIKSSVLK